MFGDRRVYQLPAVGLEHGQGTHLVRLHEAAVADYIGGKDGGQPALHTFFSHGVPLSWNAAEVAV